MNADLLRFKKIIAYLSKRHSQTFMARQRTWRQVLDNYALCDGKITLIISRYFTDVNTNISSKIVKDLKRIIVILCINYLEKKGIQEVFADCLQSTMTLHNCTDIYSYCSYIIEQPGKANNFLIRAFSWSNTKEGYMFWLNHHLDMNSFINTFLKS